MPLETNPVGIRPVSSPQQTGQTEGVSRKGDGGSSAAFSQRTDVSIQNAVDDMAGILSKISQTEVDAVDKMPQDLQKVIENVMKQAFSFDETIAKGLGSAMESQRFSMDQLGTLARMMFQLGTLAEKNVSADASETMQALLTNLKASLVDAGGQTLEPVLLSKAAFELLDEKTMADLPQDLQKLLQALQPEGQATTGLPAGESGPLGFLKQMVELLMPRPAAGIAVQTGTAGQEGVAQSLSGMTPQEQASGVPQQAGSVPAGQARSNVSAQGQRTGALVQGQQANGASQQAGNTPVGQTPASAPAQEQGANAATQGQAGSATQQAENGPAQGQRANAAAQQAGSTTAGQAQSNVPAQGQTASATQQGQQNASLQGQARPMPEESNPIPAAAQQTNMKNQGVAAQQMPLSAQRHGEAPAGQPRGTTASPHPQQPMQDAGRIASQGVQTTGAAHEKNPVQSAMQQAKSELMSQEMENTPHTATVMKDLAQLLLKDATLTQKDMLLLQSFVNGKTALMSQKEANQLQLLIRICQQNVPATVQQAAVQQNMPDLPRLWAFMQLCDMTNARKMTERQYKKAGKDLAAFVQSMKGSMGGDLSEVRGQRALNFMMPIYMGENEKSYPAYIHVYYEKTPDKMTGKMKKETWLRICVLTDNIGAVELTCRVYQDNQLDVRLFFSDTDSADDFRDSLQDIRKKMRGLKLKLGDIRIGSAGERRFI
ncbi:hypothetical protein [Mitsuokella sp. oral taxon 131]|uniref:hypothetical protein n=1 Tax=Mitsuokella sp. oral taxon 131 TaxID=1321780 RepID=UPI0003F8ED61|nr:hypothetical protein [Mitsuokella sp. oral taxon 131]